MSLRISLLPHLKFLDQSFLFYKKNNNKLLFFRSAVVKNKY